MQPSTPLVLPTQREHACPMVLTGRSRSAAAEALVQRLLDEVILQHRAASGSQKQAGDATLLKLRTATTALLADLMNLARPSRRTDGPLAGAHGMSRSHFQSAQLGFGYDIFVQVTRALEAEGLLVRRVGYPLWGRPKGQKQSAATCFLMTDEMLALAATHCVSPETWADHWTLRPEPNSDQAIRRLELRKKRKSKGGEKLPSEAHPFDLSNPRAAELDAQIARINQFLLSQNIDGLSFQGLRRIFNDGDQPDFAWNKGGRFYSILGGQAYERWNADDRQDLSRDNQGENARQSR